jgi:uncharacterized protein YraI
VTVLKKRFFIIITLVVAFVLVFAATVQAQELRGTIDRPRGINLLAGPANYFSVTAGVPNGFRARILGRNADSSWFEVVTPNGRRSAWVSADYIILDGDPKTLRQTSDLTKWNAMVGTGAQNIRDGDSDDFNIIFTLSSGDKVNVVGRNEAGSWVYVTVPQSNIKGWMSTRYLWISVPVTWLPVHH